MGRHSRASGNRESLLRFLSIEVLPFFRKHLAGAQAGPTVRLQAWGESLDPHRMDRLMQLDERLTRQYEKLLGMFKRVRRSAASKTAQSPANTLR